jgi:hypothetical protein
MEFYMNKKILSIAIMATLGVAFNASANNGKQKVEEPLRLSEDRLELVERLTEERVAEELNPNSPAEIERLKKDTLEVEKAMDAPSHDPIPQFRTIEFTPNNASEMRDVYLSPNYATTLVFLDKHQNYWPIKNYVLPLPTSTIDRSLINTGTMVLTPKKYSSKANLVVMLEDSKVPLMLTLNIGTEKVDYKTSLIINDNGPNSQVMTFGSGNASSNTQYMDLSSQAKFAKGERIDLLNGITPSGYKKRETNHGAVEIWTKGKVMFIKTKEQLLTPKLLKGDEYNHMKSPDGSYLYTTPFMPTVLLSMGGNIVPVKFK